MPEMRIIFAGTPVFAAVALEALLEAQYDIALVLTQPDRPAGRGMKTVASAVKQVAQQHELSLLQPQTLKDAALQSQLRALKADVMVVAAYGLLLPEAVLNIPSQGCLNIHASLLPRWRGAAPIQRAILAGDHETGITIMQMDAGLDTGAILLKHTLAIIPDDTAQLLHDRLSVLGAQSIVEALALLQQGKLIATRQDEAQASYAAKIKKNEAEIDWQQSAEQLERLVRAFNPNAGAYTHFHQKILKVWQAEVVVGEISERPGEVIAVDREGITVACGSGGLRIKRMQKAGGKKLPMNEFLAGYPIRPGDHFCMLGNSVSVHD